MTIAKDYWLYGFRVRSALDLPELPSAVPMGEADVSVSVGPVEMVAGGTEMQVIADGAMFEVPGTARYFVRGGTAIIVDPAADAPPRNVRLFLLGSAMGMLVHQRGLLPLHGNTLLLGDKAIIFVGHSGAGKSTLAAWLHDLGYPVLGDDVCVVRVQAGVPTVSAGLPRLRLWKNSLEATGRDHSVYPLSYTGDEGFDKYDVTLVRAAAPEREVEIAAIYVLERGEDLAIRPLHGVKAAEAVIANTYRGQYVPKVGDARSHWESCVVLAQRAHVFRLQRPWDLAAGPKITKQIVDHVNSVIGSQRD